MECNLVLANSPTPASLGASAPGFFSKGGIRRNIEGREAERGGQRGLLRRAEAGRNGRSPEGKGEGQGKYSAVGYQGAQNPHSHLVPEMPQAAGLR